LKKKLFLSAALLVTLLLVLGMAGCSPAAPDEDVTPPEEEETGPTFDKEIKIAITGPMALVQGQHMWWGAQMAAEEINAAGGVMVGGEAYGVSLIQVETDEVMDPLGAVSAVENIILSDDPDFLIGGFRTEGVMAYSELAVVDYQKIFMIVGAATNELTKGRVDEDYDNWKYIFRVTPIKSSDLVMVTIQMLMQVAEAVREELGIDTPKVAILAEALEWNEVLVQMAPQIIPTLGMEFVGTFRPSATATDLTTELRGIDASGAHIVYTIISGPMGIPFGKQWGELEIPVCPVGINVEAQKSSYYDATDGFGDYDYTLSMIAQNAAINEFTLPFIEKFKQQFGELPMYNSDSYTALYIIKAAVERAGTLDADAVVVELEKTDYISAAGRFMFDEMHDVIWAPDYITAVGIQWQDGELLGTWPSDWKYDREDPTKVFGYEGIVPYKIPPHVLEQWRQ